MAMNLGGGRRPGATAEINITPLIDVVLVLLIIFMVLLPTTMKRLTATLPRQDPSDSPSPPSEQLVLKVGPEGQLTLNGQPVEASSLRQRLSERLSSGAQKVVFFEVDDDARYDALVRYLDLARGAGATTLAIIRPDK